jgi:hypothetical protein
MLSWWNERRFKVQGSKVQRLDSNGQMTDIRNQDIIIKD